MRRKLAVAAQALGLSGVLGTGTAFAEPLAREKLPPAFPPGLERAPERPAEAETPRTGPINQVDRLPQAENP